MLNHAEALMTGETDRTTEGPKQQLIVRDSCGGRIRAGDRLESIVTEVERSSWEAKAGGNL